MAVASMSGLWMLQRVLLELAATVVATTAFTGLRQGELRGLTWESYEPAQDADSLGWLNITRSVWRSTVSDPKTTKSKAPVPVISQLAQRLDLHRQRCGCPRSGPIFANTAGKPLDLEAYYGRQMKDVLKKAG